jgi:hypothetical protein
MVELPQVKELVICVDLTSENVTDDSVVVECFKCGRKLWCSPHHVRPDRQAVCFGCVAELIKQSQGKGVMFGITPLDIMRAFAEMKKRGLI